MNWLNFLYFVLSVAVIVITIGVTVFFIRLSKTLNNANKLMEDVRKEVIPIVTNLQVTVDKMNEGLFVVDDVAKSIQGISSKFNLVVSVLQDVVSSPLIKLAGMSAGAKKVVNTLIRRENR